MLLVTFHGLLAPWLGKIFKATYHECLKLKKYSTDISVYLSLLTVVAELFVDLKNVCMPNLMWGRGETTTDCGAVSYFPPLPAHVSMESKICILGWGLPSTMQPCSSDGEFISYPCTNEFKPTREIFLVSDLALFLLLPRGEQDQWAMLDDTHHAPIPCCPCTPATTDCKTPCP